MITTVCLPPERIGFANCELAIHSYMVAMALFTMAYEEIIGYQNQFIEPMYALGVRNLPKERTGFDG
jgi:hypothetical protein